MKPVTRNILIGSAIAFPVVAFAYYKYAKSNFKLTIDSANIGSIQDGVAKVNLIFRVSSGIGIGFEVLGVNLNVYINGIFVATVQQTTPIIVPANGYVFLPTVVNLDTNIVKESIFSFALSAITGGGVTAFVNGICQAKVKVPLLSMFNFNIPVSEEFKLIGIS